jgi:SAM-dependent methyltransferase
MSDHWDQRYRSTAPQDVSWYQEVPTTSLDLLGALGVSPTESIVDVGGGASVLVDRLVERGHRDVTVVDLSAVALDAARDRVGDRIGVSWVAADVLTWEPARRWDLWHDRAVFHFFTDDADRAAYVRQMRRSLVQGGAFVIGTFATDGPTHCSGLPVRGHEIGDLVDVLGGRGVVDVVAMRREVHRTPSAADQPFTWIAGRLRSDLGGEMT